MTTITTQEHKEIAGEILRQLGGRHFIAMTGANSFCCLNDTPYGGLILKFKGSTKANYLKIVVDVMDTYTVEFYRLSARNIEQSIKPVKTYEGVYNDMLQDIFTDGTGLNTHL